MTEYDEMKKREARRAGYVIDVVARAIGELKTTPESERIYSVSCAPEFYRALGAQLMGLYFANLFGCSDCAQGEIVKSLKELGELLDHRFIGEDCPKGFFASKLEGLIKATDKSGRSPDFESRLKDAIKK